MKRLPKPTQTALTALVIASFALVLVLNILLILPALDNLLDFGSFIASGRAAASGVNPYERHLPLVFELSILRIGTVLSPNLNPPISVMLFERFASMDPLLLVTLWRVTTLVCFALAIVMLVKKYPASSTPIRIVWAFSLAGLWHMLQLGQIYAPLLLLALGTWFYLNRGQRVLAGLALGLLIAAKPNFVLWALVLGIAGYWSTLITAGFTSIAISLLPLAHYGVDIYFQWLDAIAEFETQGLFLPGNNSLPSALTRLGLEAYTIPICVAFLFLVLYFAYKNRSHTQQINGLGILVSLLLSPVAWTAYTVLCLPIFFAKQKWTWPYWAAALIFMVPYFMILAVYQDSDFNFLFFGWFYGWGLLMLLAASFTEKEGADLDPRPT